MLIGNHAFVSLEYVLKDDQGQVIDTSEDDGPLAYVHGTESIFPVLEKALEGHKVGDELVVRVPAEDAYGEHDEDLVEAVTRDQLPDDIEIEVGMEFEIDDDEGGTVVTVSGIEGDTVLLDANHPLAGVNLLFELIVRQVRAATEEELADAEHDHSDCDHDH